jgi:hypothetical protein
LRQIHGQTPSLEPTGDAILSLSDGFDRNSYHMILFHLSHTIIADIVSVIAVGFIRILLWPMLDMPWHRPSHIEFL